MIGLSLGHHQCSSFGLFYTISLAWQFILNKLTELIFVIIVAVVCHCLHFAFLNIFRVLCLSACA